MDALIARAVSAVPPGRVTTPGAIAGALGDRRAARFVGGRLGAMGRGEACEVPGDLPLHRVVLSTGEAVRGGARLRKEGVLLRAGRVADMASSMFDDLGRSFDRPLARLASVQNELAGNVTLEDATGKIRRVAGVDVSYGSDGSGAVSCCTVTGPDGDSVLEQVSVRTVARFPYIPGYLGFREVPPMLEALNALDGPPDVVLVDGHGVLHPRRFGVACHLGMTAGLPSVGCAKRVLVGREGESGGYGRGVVPMLLDGEHLGWKLAPRRGRRPAVVSPGSGMGVDTAREVAVPLLAHQMPEPIRSSHIASGHVLRGGHLDMGEKRDRG